LSVQDDRADIHQATACGTKMAEQAVVFLSTWQCVQRLGVAGNCADIKDTPNEGAMLKCPSIEQWPI